MPFVGQRYHKNNSSSSSDHVMVSLSYLRLCSGTVILLQNLPYQVKSRHVLPLMVLDFFEKNPCHEHYTIHVMHNAFHKGIIALVQDLKGLAFDLQAWFKLSLCREHDFREVSDNVKKRWWKLYLIQRRIVERWDDAKEYFLNWLSEKKKCKNALPKNCHY